MLHSNKIGAGTNLVLLHGWCFNSKIFKNLVSQYKNKYCIHLIDLPGHDKSPNIEGNIDDWCQHIIQVMPPNPIILGWSLGGLLAINIASKIKVSSLILVGSTPNFIKNKQWQYGIEASIFKEFHNLLATNRKQALKRFVSLQTKNTEQIRYLKTTINNCHITSKALNQGLNIMLNTDLTNILLNLKIPIKAILGKQDALVPYTINEWYKANNIQTKIFNSGHLPFLNSCFSL